MKTFSRILLSATLLATASTASAQFDLSRILQGVGEAAQAATISDEQVAQYVHEYIVQLDAKSKVLPESSPYTKRLRKLTEGLTDVDGIPLNFKVYQTQDLNAFACADGSVRVYSGLMDVMTDDELLGVIGHEIGHVAHHDTKKAFKHALVTAAITDGLASTSGKIAALTDSQLGAIGKALDSSHYSRKQEQEADDYGYEFLKEHGKNPRAMGASFQKLKQMETQSGAVQSTLVNRLFSDHPELDDRIARIEKRADKEHIPALSASPTLKSNKPQYNTTPTDEQKTSQPAKKPVQLPHTIGTIGVEF